MHKKVHNEHKKKIFNRGVRRSSTLLLSLPGCGKSFPHTFFLTNNEPLKKGGKSRALVGSGCSEKNGTMARGSTQMARVRYLPWPPYRVSVGEVGTHTLTNLVIENYLSSFFSSLFQVPLHTVYSVLCFRVL